MAAHNRTVEWYERRICNSVPHRELEECQQRVSQIDRDLDKCFHRLSNLSIRVLPLDFLKEENARVALKVKKARTKIDDLMMCNEGLETRGS